MERPLRSALKKNASPPSPASPKTSHAPGTPINSTAGASRKEDKVVENKGEKPSSSLKRREIRVVSIKDAVLLHAGFVYAGIKDASAWPTSLLTIYGSKTIQLYTFKCVLLNGFIFLGSLLLFHSLILPLSRYIYSSATQQSHPPYLDSLFTIAYYVLWLYPMYAISFLANAMWYQKIADRSYSIQVGKPVATKLNYDKLLAMISGEAYRTLLLLNFLILPLLIKFIPYVGPFLCFISFCWLASFYSFEYKWMSQGWTLQQRVDHFEERWAYYIGFGLPCTICTYFFPLFVSQGLFAILFPIYIIMSNRAKPLPRSNELVASRFIPMRLPIFKIAIAASAFCIKKVVGRSRSKSKVAVAK